MRCNQCNTEISEDLRFCPGCGIPLYPGETFAESLPRKRLIWLLPVICVLLLLSVAVVCFLTIHIPTEATCTSPATCSLCGKELEEALGHNWKDATCDASKTCRTCGKTKGDPLEHSWTDATCTQAKTCLICGEEEGSPTQHQWNGATCDQSAVCTQCGLTTGEPLGHTWTDATFTAPKTCTVCGDTQGDPISYQRISVEDEVTAIRQLYNIIEPNRQGKAYRTESLRDGVVAHYTDSGALACVVVYRGTPGIGDYSSVYSRIYYFSEGKLIFAFFEGTDAHRLYFYEEMLMRWRYKAPGTAAINHDFTFSREFCRWETLALEEADSFR